MRRKREIKVFWLTDLEKAASYLSSMHQKGWRFTGVQGRFLYCFEKTEPKDVVYQVDFRGWLFGKRSAYLQLYADYGWEYVCSCNSCYIFRKEKTVDEEMTIFSDRDGRLDLYRQLLYWRILPLVTYYLFIGVAVSLNWLSLSFFLGLSLVLVPILGYLLTKVYFFYKENQMK